MKLISVIGQGQPDKALESLAFEVGRLLASRGVSILTGGLGGVMAAVAAGFRDARAAESRGVVVGLLPGTDGAEGNPFLDVALATGMGEGRDYLITVAAEGFIAIGRGHGTLAEIALALKMKKRVVGVNTWPVDGVTDVGRAPHPAVAAVELLFQASATTP